MTDKMMNRLLHRSITGRSRLYNQCRFVRTSVHSAATNNVSVSVTDTNVLVCPPNLKIDRKSKSSPFYGLDPIGMDSKHYEDASLNKDDDDEKEEDAELSNLLNQLNVNGGDGTAYDISSKKENVTMMEEYHAIPLPERLTVPILSVTSDSDDDEEEQGEESEEVMALDERVFGMEPVRTDLIHRVVVYQRNKKRGKRFPARTKTINERSGSGKKMRPQKGGGVARAGHKRAAHWRGGVKAHGPKGVLQDYTTKLNKKVRKAGLRHMLSQKLLEGNLFVVKNFVLDDFKTKGLSKSLLENMGIGGRYGTTALMVDSNVKRDEIANFYVAQRNIKEVTFVSQLGCTVYGVLKNELLVLSVDAVKALEERLIDG